MCPKGRAIRYIFFVFRKKNRKTKKDATSIPHTKKIQFQTMISICIPIYNFNVTRLVVALEKEIANKKLKTNIVLIDDCSNSEFKDKNFNICSRHQYIQLEQNIGRAKIRNLFLEHTKSEYLIFLDCDSLIISENFITNYANAIKEQNAQVICGGRIYDSKQPPRNKRLSWKYGIEIESKTYQTRLLEPNKSFMTNNFLIKREILEQIKFDERLSKYGHEDTLFGYYLKLANIRIGHINNPILNGDIEENKKFLKKTELGIVNLIAILDYINYDQEFIKDVALLSFYYRLKKTKLLFLVRFILMILGPIIKYQLEKGYVNLSQFNLYKLSLLIRVC